MFNYREILFRGFCEDPNGTKTITIDGKEIKGDWTTWGFHYDDTRHQTFFHNPCLVPIPSTIGQFSGYYDGTSWARLLPREKDDFRMKYSRQIGEWVSKETAKENWKGLKIMEGDLLMDKNDPDINGYVIFENGSFRVVFYGRCGAMTESGWNEDAGDYGIIEIMPFDELALSDYQVVGNIYECPLPFSLP